MKARGNEGNRGHGLQKWAQPEEAGARKALLGGGQSCTSALPLGNSWCWCEGSKPVCLSLQVIHRHPEATQSQRAHNFCLFWPDKFPVVLSLTFLVASICWRYNTAIPHPITLHSVGIFLMLDSNLIPPISWPINDKAMNRIKLTLSISPKVSYIYAFDSMIETADLPVLSLTAL